LSLPEGTEQHGQSWTGPCGRSMVETYVIQEGQRARLATCSGGSLARDTPLEGALWLRVYCGAKWPLLPGLEAPLALAMLLHWGSSALGRAWQCWTSIRHG